MKKNAIIKMAVLIVTIAMAGSVFAWDGNGIENTEAMNSNYGRCGRHSASMMDSNGYGNGYGQHHSDSDWTQHQKGMYGHHGWNHQSDDATDVSGR